MKLSFFAKGDALVTVPGQAHSRGQHLRRVGRTWTNEAIPPATKEPFTIDSDSEGGARLAKLIGRDQSLYAADKATADFCQVPFVDVEFINNKSWAPKAAPKPVEAPKDGSK